MDKHTLTILGHATGNPQQLESKKGKTFTKIGIAVNEYRGPDIENKVSFYDAVAFGSKLQEKLLDASKGDLMIVNGTPEVSAYESSTGELRANLSCKVDYVKVFSQDTKSAEEDLDI